MCGGRGTRLDTPREKPLVKVGGRPMIEHVVTACMESELDAVAAAVSPHVPATRAFLSELSVEVIDTPGDGYVADLDRALEGLDDPVLTVAADLPLLEARVIDRILAIHQDGSCTVCIPEAVKDLLGTSIDHTWERCGQTVVPSGLNVVSPGAADAVHVSYDVRLAINVNRPRDVRIAERLQCDTC